MEALPGKNTSASFYLESVATSQFLPKILDEALRNNARKLEVRLKEEKTLSLTFHSEQKKHTKEFACTPAFWKGILTSVNLKSCAESQNSGTDLSPSKRRKALTITLRANTALRCTIEMQKGIKAEPALVFDEITSIKNQLNELVTHQTDYNCETLKLISQAKKGIILCNHLPTQNQGMDGLSLCYSLRSDLRICHSPSTDLELKKVLELSESSLVLLGIESDDVVEGILETGNLFRDDRTNIIAFYEALVATVYSRAVRTTCKKCSKRTTISKEFISSLPPALQPASDFEYMVGRGCGICHHSAYDGNVQLISSLQMTPELTKLLERGASAAQITELASRVGAKSLLEDGLDKISQRITTFEEILGAVKRISSGFLAAAIHRSGRKDLENPLEAELRIQLEGLDNEYFFKETKAHERRKILIVEDNQDQLDILSMVLEKEGYDIMTALNGREALEVLKDNSTALVVCDLMMPVMNGEDFVRALRDTPKGTHTPVLMLTAINDEDTEYNLLAAGADDYCSKGTKKKLILKRIERLIHRTSNPLQ